MFVAIRMSYDQSNKVLHPSDRMPALFSVNDALDEGHTHRIVKNQLSRRKVNAVLLFVGSVLSVIPLKV